MAPIDSFQEEYRFLSNFYSSDLTHIFHYGLKFPTVEHAYQASKIVDVEQRIRISCLESPGQAKRYGKKLVLRKDWEDVKVEIMRGLLYQKFGPSTHLSSLLMSTYPKELIEGNTWGDQFWGVCNGKGANWLGILLMEVREFLQQYQHNIV